jgi:transposase
MVSVAITRTEFSSSELRVRARRSDDTRQARRLLAIAMVLDGSSRATAAESCAMDRQTLRDWVHRFNAEGLEGLADRPRPGRPSFLSSAQQAEVATWVEAGPDLEKDRVVRWRRVDLCERIEASFGVKLDVRTVGKLLRTLDFRRISARPRHPKSDEAAQAEYKKSSAISCAQPSPIGSAVSRSSFGGKTKPALGSKAP